MFSVDFSAEVALKSESKLVSIRCRNERQSPQRSGRQHLRRNRRGLAPSKLLRGMPCYRAKVNAVTAKMREYGKYGATTQQATHRDGESQRPRMLGCSVTVGSSLWPARACSRLAPEDRAGSCVLPKLSLKDSAPYWGWRMGWCSKILHGTRSPSPNHAT